MAFIGMILDNCFAMSSETFEKEDFGIRERIYVFGFDNTLVNTEDLIIDFTNQVLDINMTKDFWYTNLHSVTDVETEISILERKFHVTYIPDLQQKVGEMFVQALSLKMPNKSIYRLVQEHMSTCHFLTGSPLSIVQLYFKAWSIDIEVERLHTGIYNASGNKEKILAELQEL